MAKKNIVVDAPEQDPTIGKVNEAAPAKIPTRDFKKYMFLIHPDVYKDLNALVISRNLEKIKDGAPAKTSNKPYTLNNLLTVLVNEYLERDEVKDEVAKAHKKLGV